jgi:hypothetical protein
MKKYLVFNIVQLDVVGLVEFGLRDALLNFVNVF